MRIVGLDHVQLAMPPGREAEARAFYSGVLGLHELEKPEPMRSHGGCWFELAGAQVHLGIEADFRPAQKAHPALVVADLAAARTTLEAARAPIKTAAPVDGRARIFTEDPFGNRIELLAAAGGVA